MVEEGFCQCAYSSLPYTLRSTPKEEGGKNRTGPPVLPNSVFSHSVRIVTGMITILTFPAGCICTGSWGEARSPGAGCRAWGCMGRREDCREQSQDLRQPGAPPSIALPLTSQGSTLTESEKPVCWLACSICFCKDRALPGWRNPKWGRRVCEMS